MNAAYTRHTEKARPLQSTHVNNSAPMAIESITPQLEKVVPEAQDFLPLLGTDYVELYVGNAKQAAHFYKTAFGFQSLAYAGPETGMKDVASYVVQQGKIRLV